MAKATVKYCDRCKQQINSADQHVLDFLETEYPNQDICPDCDLLISAAKGLQQYYLIQGRKFSEVLLATLEKYND